MKTLIFQFLMMTLFGGCAVSSANRDVSLYAEPIHENILLLEPGLKRFELFGPFDVIERFDREITINLDETVVVDHFAARSSDALPIIVISHGNFSGKGAHRQQAHHLASWGFHVVTFEVPNRDQWLENGERLRRFTEIVNRLPGILGPNVDRNRIIVVGHSFGGSASVLAISKGAPVIGAILLDPAVVHQNVVTAMKLVDLPVVLLGSDRLVFMARGRSRFLKNLAGDMVEVTIPKSTHDDAQGPSMFSKSVLGVDPFTSGARQRIFSSMLTVAVIGLSSSGTLDFPARIYSREAKSGVLKDYIYRDKVR